MVNIAIACSLCAIHVHAERNATEDQADDSMNAWTRISSGPYYWSTMDKIFFWALIMVALEILNYLCGKSGGKLVAFSRWDRLIWSQFSTFMHFRFSMDECQTNSS